MRGFLIYLGIVMSILLPVFSSAANNSHDLSPLAIKHARSISSHDAGAAAFTYEAELLESVDDDETTDTDKKIIAFLREPTFATIIVAHSFPSRELFSLYERKTRIAYPTLVILHQVFRI